MTYKLPYPSPPPAPRPRPGNTVVDGHDPARSNAGHLRVDAHDTLHGSTPSNEASPEARDEESTPTAPGTRFASLDEVDDFATVCLARIRDNGWPADNEEQLRQVLCLAEEVGELVGAFRRWAGLARRTGPKHDVEHELADVLIVTLITAQVLAIDLRAAVTAKAEHLLTRGWKDPR